MSRHINIFGWQQFWNLILKLTEMLWTSCIVNIWLLQGKNLTNSRYFSVKMQDPINPNTSNAIPNCTIPNTTTVTIRDQKWSVLKRYLGFHCCLKPPVVTERIFTWPAKTNVKEYLHGLQGQMSKHPLFRDLSYMENITCSDHPLIFFFKKLQRDNSQNNSYSCHHPIWGLTRKVNGDIGL